MVKRPKLGGESIIMKSYLRRNGSSISFSLYSRLRMSTSSTVAPANAGDAGKISTAKIPVFFTTSPAGILPINA